MQEINPRIQAVQDAIKKDSRYKNILIDGVLIASTIQTLTLYDSSLEINSLDEEYDENNFMFGENKDFPSYNLLYEMAEGMIVEKVTITCEKKTKDENEDEITITRTTSYLKEMVGIDGYEKSSCSDLGEGYKEITSKQSSEFYLYPTVYEKYYLPKLFSDQFDLNKDEIEDRKIIDTYIESVFDTYNEYRTLVYDESISLEGITYVDTKPLVTDDGLMALPLNLNDLNLPDGPFTYGGYLSSKFQMDRPSPTCVAAANGNAYEISKCDKKNHVGIDLATYGMNVPIYAVYPGVVTRITTTGERGNRVVISHDTDGDGEYDIRTGYQHLASILVNVGSTVNAGDEIGICGNSGLKTDGNLVSTGIHLHFEVTDLSYSNETCNLGNATYAYRIWGYDNECNINPEPRLKIISGNLKYE